MRIASSLGRGEIGFNMTPMIDIVFQLIIFFLVSNHLAQREVQVQVNLPDASSGERPAEENVRRVVVNVLPTGRLSARRPSTARLESLLRYGQRPSEQPTASPGSADSHRQARAVKNVNDPLSRARGGLERQVRSDGKIEPMRIPARHAGNREQPTVGMTPMIDVIFNC